MVTVQAATKSSVFVYVSRRHTKHLSPDITDITPVLCHTMVCVCSLGFRFCTADGLRRHWFLAPTQHGFHPLCLCCIVTRLLDPCGFNIIPFHNNRLQLPLQIEQLPYML